MQRLIVLMMAVASLLMAPGALRAQDDGPAADPTKGPQAIDEPSTAPHGSPTQAGAPRPTSDSDEPKAVQPQQSNVVPVIHPTVTQARHATRVADKVSRKHNWFGSQLALLILGVLGAVLAAVVTPNAAKSVADHVSSNSKRDLAVGAFVGLGMLMLLVADAILLKLPLIRLLWAPFGIMVAFAPLLVLGFGWLAGMRYAGDYVASRLNHNGDGTLFGRMTLGLVAFFVLNVVLGSLCSSFGAVSLCAELCVALMGLGATAVIAAGRGFGGRRD